MYLREGVRKTDVVGVKKWFFYKYFFKGEQVYQKKMDMCLFL